MLGLKTKKSSGTAPDEGGVACPVFTRRHAICGLAAFGTAVSVLGSADILHAAETASVRDYRAAGDGIADDTAAFDKAVRGGASVISIPRGTYRLTRQIAIPSGVTLQGTGNPKIILDVAGFDETNIARTYEANACAFLFQQCTGGGVSGLTFAPSAYGKEHVVMAIALRDCANMQISDCTFNGFSKTKIIRVDSCTDCSVSDNHFRDCLLASSSPAQLTCIDIDDNRVRGGSARIAATGNQMRAIGVSPEFLAAFGDQTDGINISHASSAGHYIARNTMEKVGEGIDCFGHDCVIENNILRNCHSFGVKLIHGAQRNVVRDNRIEFPGLGGIVLTGSGQDGNDTAENIITGNTISGVGAGGHWPEATTFGIKLEDDHGGRTARKNHVVANTIRPGPRMVIGILETDQAIGNVVRDNSVSGSIRADYILRSPAQR